MRPPASALLTSLLLALACGCADQEAAQRPDGAGGAEATDGRTGTLVVLNKGAATATVIDIASGETLATLPTGPSPHELAMSSDGLVAVGTDYGSNTLTVIDVPGLAVARRIDLGRHTRPHGIVFLPGDSLVAVTSEQTRRVVIVRVADGEVVQSIDTEGGGSHMLAVTADGATIVTGNMRDATVSVLDRATGQVTASHPTPPQPEAVAVSGDGRRIFVGSNEDGTVSVIDTETGELETPFEGFAWPYRILPVPEQDLLIVPDLGNEEVRFFSLGMRQDDRAEGEAATSADAADIGEALRTLPLPGTRPQGVALTADRSTLFLSLSGTGEVAVIDLETLDVVRRIPAGPSPDGIGWSPVVVR